MKYALIGAALIVAGSGSLCAGCDVRRIDDAALRFIVGFGAGLANAAGNGHHCGALSTKPERTAGYAFGLVYLVGGATLPCFAVYDGILVTNRGVFLSVAVVVLVFTPLLFALPDTPLQEEKKAVRRAGCNINHSGPVIVQRRGFPDDWHGRGLGLRRTHGPGRQPDAEGNRLLFCLHHDRIHRRFVVRRLAWARALAGPCLLSSARYWFAPVAISWPIPALPLSM